MHGLHRIADGGPAHERGGLLDLSRIIPDADPDGAELLVHIGIDTVNLKGEGFTAHRRKGDRVRPGDVVVSVDLASVSVRVPSMATPVIVTNGDRFDVSAPDLGGSTTVKVAELSPKG